MIKPKPHKYSEFNWAFNPLNQRTAFVDRYIREHVNVIITDKLCEIFDEKNLIEKLQSIYVELTPADWLTIDDFLVLYPYIKKELENRGFDIIDHERYYDRAYLAKDLKSALVFVIQYHLKVHNVAYVYQRDLGLNDEEFVDLMKRVMLYFEDVSHTFENINISKSPIPGEEIYTHRCIIRKI